MAEQNGDAQEVVPPYEKTQVAVPGHSGPTLPAISVPDPMSSAAAAWASSMKPWTAS
jgi:hypothetical protein